MTDERLGRIYKSKTNGFVGMVTTVAEYYGRKEKMLELTADTGSTGDAKSQWVPETLCEPHDNKTTGF